MGMILSTMRLARSMLLALERTWSMLLCMVEDTAVGKEGDDEISLYHARTKSRTIMIRISFSEADTDG